MAEIDSDNPFFSREMLERWGEIPADKPLAVPLGKYQIDALVLSIRQSIIAQSHAAVSLRQFMDGDRGEAEKTWLLYQDALNSSFDHINSFMRHVMTHARVEVPNE